MISIVGTIIAVACCLAIIGGLAIASRHAKGTKVGPDNADEED